MEGRGRGQRDSGDKDAKEKLDSGEAGSREGLRRRWTQEEEEDSEEGALRKEVHIEDLGEWLAFRILYLHNYSNQIEADRFNFLPNVK